MPTSQELVAALAGRGVRLVTGVPCSLAPGFVAAAEAHPQLRWVPVANEGDGVALAAGAGLGGRPAAVLLQNSGLGNAVNPLSSLTHTFGLPVLLLVTWRGRPDGDPDEPQHRLMGAATRPLLDLLEVPQTLLEPDPDALAPTLDGVLDALAASGRSQALVIPRGALTVGDGPRDDALPAGPGGDRRPTGDGQPARPATPAASGTPAAAAPTDGTAPAAPLDPDAVVAAVAAGCADDLVLATTGLTGRALVAAGPRPNHLAMVGSMGCAPSLALGLALARPDRRVVVLDGDGALLMRLGALTAVARAAPPRLLHLLLDNGRHASTGGQPGLSAVTDPVGLARASGYAGALPCASLETLARLLEDPPSGPTLVHLPVAPWGAPAPRPSVAPERAAAALRDWLERTPAP